jgi:hypothetical protein
MAHQVNLLDPSLYPGPKPFSARKMAIGLVGLMAGACVVLAFAELQVRRLEPLAAMNASQLAEQRAELLRLSQKIAAIQPSKLLDEEITNTEARLGARQALLAELKGSESAAQGFASHLAALARRRIEGVWLTRVTIAGANGQVMLEGRALQAAGVPAYLAALRADPAFSGRNVTELKVFARETGKAPAHPGPGAQPPPAALVAERYVEFGVTLVPGATEGQALLGMRSAL